MARYVQDRTPLHVAAGLGYTDVVIMLLTKHADANVQDVGVSLCAMSLVLEQNIPPPCGTCNL